MNIKLISRYVGIALIFNALFMLLAAFISLYDGLDSSFSPLITSFFITFIVGVFPLIFVRRSEAISIQDGFAITIFSWVLSCLFGMMPYLMWGGEFTMINAFFESVSGYTTSGGTILTDIEALPSGLLFWRSSTHFIGGLGVVVFMLLVLPTMSTFRIRMSKMEISSLSRESYKFKTNENIRVIIIIYMGIAVLAFFSFLLAGMSGFDAINHAFSVASTGGFSTKNASIQSFNSLNIELVTMFFMFIGGLHFGLMYAAIFKRSTKLFTSRIARYFVVSVILASLAVAADIKINGDVPTWGMALRSSFFQVISISTTTGFATSDTSVWSTFSISLLIFMSLQAACSGSTTGGLKVDRVLIFYQTIRSQLKKLLHPNAVIPVRIGKSTIVPEVSHMVTLYIALFVFMTLIGTVMLAFTGLGITEAFTSSLSSMTNVGPAFGAGCGSLGNFGAFSGFAKFVMSIQMLLGRLEIYPLFMIFVIFKRGN